LSAEASQHALAGAQDAVTNLHATGSSMAAVSTLTARMSKYNSQIVYLI
jgi:hypothetical protein